MGLQRVRLNKLPNKIQNLKGCHLSVYKAVNGVIIHMGNDWNTCLDFIFDSKEQFDLFVDYLNNLKKESNYEQKEMQGEKEI